MSKKAIFEIRVRAEVEHCERLIDNEIEARQGYRARNANATTLNDKLKTLESYLPKIEDKTLFDRCKSAIGSRNKAF